MKISMSFGTLVPILLLWLAVAPTIGFDFNHRNFTRVLCRPTERDALLKLKHDLTDPSNRLVSWVGDGDCCRWLGIVCHKVTGHVIELNLRSLSLPEYYDAHDTAYKSEDYGTTLLSGKINPSLLHLKHLMHLDLSNNAFEGIRIPKFLGSLKSLKYLNLAGAGFGGVIPHQLRNLSNLQYLNLRADSNSYDYESYVENLDWLSGLSSLEFLDLSSVNLSKAFDCLKVINNALPSLVKLHLSDSLFFPIPPLVNVNFSSLLVLDISYYYYYSDQYSIRTQKFPSWISHLKTLVSLSLSGNYFEGTIPNDLQNLTSLRELDLSFNQFNSLVPNWLYGFSCLELLNLGYNDLHGEVSSSITNMTSLISLDMSYNYELEFNRGIPASFKNLCNLKFLSFSFIKLNQNIAEVFLFLLGCVSDKLESLVLDNCQLFGGLTCHVGQFKNLVTLRLRDNQLNGTLPDCFGGLKKLNRLVVSNNLISGPMPMSFGGLKELKELDISNNLLVDDVTEFHFANLTKLWFFLAGGNRLILRVSPIDWIPPLYLNELELRSWNIGPKFPRGFDHSSIYFTWIYQSQAFLVLFLFGSGTFRRNLKF